MADTFVAEIKRGIMNLMDHGGVNPEARFQTPQRRIKFPGNDLYFTFSLVPINVKSGISANVGGDKHQDVRPDVDESGNFNCMDDYVGESRKYCDNLRERFTKARREGYNLVLLDQEAYINRRLRKGDIVPPKKKKSVKK